MNAIPMFPRVYDPSSPEMMDRERPDPRLLQQQLRSLRLINRFFGGAQAYERTFRRLQPPVDSGTLLDLCTGSGDHLQNLRPLYPNLQVIALDRQWETLRTAQNLLTHPSAHCVQADSLQLPFPDQSVDFVLCSLALHHFSEDQAVAILQEMRRVARRGGAVIDLKRGSFAYFSVCLLTAIWLTDPYTKHDGRASVRAAFSVEELIHLAKRAEWADYWHMELPWFRQSIGFRKAS